LSRTFHHQRGERRIRVRGIRKDPPDLRRLARALIELAQLQAETEAEAEHKGVAPEKRPGQRAPKNSGPISKSDQGDAP
jgi:hypothetical protein